MYAKSFGNDRQEAAQTENFEAQINVEVRGEHNDKSEKIVINRVPSYDKGFINDTWKHHPRVKVP